MHLNMPINSKTKINSKINEKAIYMNTPQPNNLKKGDRDILKYENRKN